MSDLKLRTVKMRYDPAFRAGDAADEITFADFEYVAANDNGGMTTRSVTLLTFV